MKRGKRGGFLVIYYLSDHIVYLLTIYAKAKKEEVSVKEIKEALRELKKRLRCWRRVKRMVCLYGRLG